MLRTSAVFLALPLLAGCFRYVPLQPDALGPSATVRAHLTQDGVERHRSLLGLHGRSLEGTVARVSDQGLELLTGGVGASAGASVRFRWEEIEALERRQLARGRTFLLVGAGLAAGVGLLHLAGGEASSDPGEGGEGDFIRVPVVRIPWSPGGG